MGQYNRISYINEGYGVTIPLAQFSDDERYKNYAASCQYSYDKKKEKYSVCMWLKRKDIDNKYHFDYQGIDTQYVSGNRETIRGHICRIVDQAMKNGFFEKPIEQFEYMIACFDRGNECFEQEEQGA